MKNIKKLLIIFLALVTVMATVAACGGKKNANDAKKDDVKTEDKAEDKAESDSAEDAADESWATVEKAGVFRLGLDDSFPPMGFRDDKNEIVGFDIDIATEVTNRLGIKLELTPIDWDLKEAELDGKNIDCIWNGYSFSDERNEKQTLSQPYMSNKQVVVVMKSSGITDLAGAAGKKLALQQGSTAERALEKATDFKKSLAEVVPFKDNVTAFLDVEAGSTDAILLDIVVAEYYISQKDNSDDYLILDEALETEDYVIGFRKADVALKDKIESTIVEMAKDGKLAELSQKWFGRDVTVIGK